MPKDLKFFISVSHPVHGSSLEPHMGKLSWEEIYRDWPEETSQYYWRSLDLQVT